MYNTKFLILIIAALSSLSACTDKNTVNSSISGIDSLTEESQEGEYLALKNAYVKQYMKNQLFDSSYTVNANTIHVKLRYYCLFDSLIIPSNYNWGAHPTEFLTHNFASKISITSATDTLVNQTITKNTFKDILTDNLKTYGVLLYPTLRGYDSLEDSFIFHYSISIPLTDIGRSVLLKIDMNGNIKATEN